MCFSLVSSIFHAQIAGGSTLKMKSLDKYVVIAMLYIFGWSLAFFIAWLIFREEPSVLEGCILAPGVVELVCTAFIQHGKKKDDPEATPLNGEDFEIVDISDLEDVEG